MHAVNIDGTNIHFRTAGQSSGMALVFVGSLGTDWRSWERVADRFAGRCRLVFHDKQGHGLSDTATGSLRIRDHVRNLAGLLDELAISEAVVCGLSVGGMIALGLAAERPQAVRGLVLCDTGHRIGTDELWNRRIETVQAQGIEAIADGVLERWFSADFRAARPAETALWRNMLVRTPPEGYAATCAAIRDADFTAAARSLAMPALCLCGTQDQATPPELMRELSGLIPDSRYHDIPGAGHLAPVEHADEVASHMQAFLEELAVV